MSYVYDLYQLVSQPLATVTDCNHRAQLFSSPARVMKTLHPCLYPRRGKCSTSFFNFPSRQSYRKTPLILTNPAPNRIRRLSTWRFWILFHFMDDVPVGCYEEAFNMMRQFAQPENTRDDTSFLEETGKRNHFHHHPLNLPRAVPLRPMASLTNPQEFEGHLHSINPP